MSSLKERFCSLIRTKEKLRRTERLEKDISRAMENYGPKAKALINQATPLLDMTPNPTDISVLTIQLQWHLTYKSSVKDFAQAYRRALNNNIWEVIDSTADPNDPLRTNLRIQSRYFLASQTAASLLFPILKKENRDPFEIKINLNRSLEALQNARSEKSTTG